MTILRSYQNRLVLPLLALSLQFLALPAFALNTHELAEFSHQAYNAVSGKLKAPAGYTVLATRIDKASGFQGAAFGSSSNIVVAFAGTQPKDPKDVLADLGIGAGDVAAASNSLLQRVTAKIGFGSNAAVDKARATPVRGTAATQAQLKSAEAFFREVAAKQRKLPITITGHSLGGFLAQVVGAHTGTAAITFNAPGASSFGGAGTASIVNHIRKHDLVGAYGRHIGHLVAYADVPVELTNIKERYAIRNHAITTFANDLQHGLKLVK